MSITDEIAKFSALKTFGIDKVLKMTPSLQLYKGFLIRNSQGEKLLVIQSGKIIESKDFMIRENIKGLEINMSLGYPDLDVKFLNDFKFIETLVLIHQPIRDVDEINNLHKLKRLELDSYFYNQIDFNNFPNLEDCYIHWTPNAKNLFKRTKLKALHLYVYKKDDLSELNNLKILEKLRIDNSSIKSLNGLQNLKKLKDLDLGLLTKLTDIDDIKNLPLLNKLNIQSCKKIPFEKLWQLKNLKWLNLSDIGNIPTIKGIEQLNMLEEVYMVGDTKILDGDTSPLLKLANIKKVGLAHLSHYKPTTLEIQAKIEGKDLKTLLQEYKHMRIYKKILKEISTQ